MYLFSVRMGLLTECRSIVSQLFSVQLYYVVKSPQGLFWSCVVGAACFHKTCVVWTQNWEIYSPSPTACQGEFLFVFVCGVQCFFSHICKLSPRGKKDLYSIFMCRFSVKNAKPTITCPLISPADPNPNHNHENDQLWDICRHLSVMHS